MNNILVWQPGTNLQFSLLSTIKFQNSTTKFAQIKSMATKSHSLRLAALAARVATSGHFDAVIAEIDKMITTLRQEEDDDVPVVLRQISFVMFIVFSLIPPMCPVST